MWFSFSLISVLLTPSSEAGGIPWVTFMARGCPDLQPATLVLCIHDILRFCYTLHIKCVRFLLTKGNRIFSISYSFVDSFLTTNSMREKLLSLRAVRFSVGGNVLVLAYNTMYVLWWTLSSLYSRRPDLAFFPREMTAGPRSDHHTPRRGDAKTKQSHMAASRRSQTSQ